MARHKKENCNRRLSAPSTNSVRTPSGIKMNSDIDSMSENFGQQATITERGYQTPGKDQKLELAAASTKNSTKRSNVKSEVEKAGSHTISRDDMKRGWLYVVSLGSSNPGYDRVKVGFTNSTDNRLKPYKTISPDAICIFEKYTIKWAESQAKRMLAYYRVTDSATEAGNEVFELPNVMAEKVCMCAYELTGYVQVELRYTTYPEPRTRFQDDYADDTVNDGGEKSGKFS